MKNNQLLAREQGKRIVLVLVFVALGYFITIVFKSFEPTDNPESGSILFERSWQIFASIPTWRIGLGNLDGDSDVDAVFANGQANDSQVWVNDGDGFFTDTGQSLGQFGHGVNVDDLDGDGDMDIFLATFGTDEGPNEVWLNQGR